MGLIVVRRDVGMHLLQRRQNAAATGGIVGAVVFVMILCVGLTFYLALRRIRTYHDNPKYIPTKYLKRKYIEWTPSALKKRRASSLMDRRSIQERRSSSPANTLQRLQNLGANDVAGVNADGTPNRHASIRSIMTLPSYTADARDHEQVIGREGERGGIDTVVEYPEDEDEEERRREEEMESLYQIRVRRREERAAREERRRLRREARARNDREALERLREEGRQARTAAGNDAQEELTAAQLLEQHRNQQRGRRMASVDYAQVGLARHDGSRVRANSAESDRPLLDSAASMSGRNRGLSEPRTPPLPSSSSVTLPSGHTYHQSNSSLSRFTTNAADVSDMEDDLSDVEGRITPYGERRPSTSRGPSAASGRPSMSTVGRHAWNRSSIDLGNYSLDSLPREHPPGYEESVRGQSSVDVSRSFDEPEDTDPAQNQSSYSRGRRFGLPRGWGGRKQQSTDEEQGREMVGRVSPNGQASAGARPPTTVFERPNSEAPAYESPVSPMEAGAPQLPTLTTLPSIEVTPFTPTEGRDGENRWPL